MGGGGQGGCGRRIESFVKIKKTKHFFRGGVWADVNVFVKIQKNNMGGVGSGGGGGQVDVKEE